MAKARAKKKSAPKAGWSLALVNAIWPQERDFMERPDRYRYVRKLLSPSGCVFCAAAKGREPLLLAKDELAMVVMNKYPYNTGHLLVLPVAHVGDLWKLDGKINARMAYWLKESARILTDVLGCQGLNMGMNHGAVAGAGARAMSRVSSASLKPVHHSAGGLAGTVAACPCWNRAARVATTGGP
ncbi:MAG TPA: HIT domain-containing protein [Bdellovibrionales bacterium]|nr:HIT domain-containing protein [Bdellovibrionales bacterium]